MYQYLFLNVTFYVVQLGYSYQCLVLYSYFYGSAQILLWISQVYTGFRPAPNCDSSPQERLLPRRQGFVISTAIMLAHLPPRVGWTTSILYRYNTDYSSQTYPFRLNYLFSFDSDKLSAWWSTILHRVKS